MLCLRAACYWLSAWQQAGAVHHSTRTAAIVNLRRFVIKSSLFTGKWVSKGQEGRRGSVRVRARARVSARVTVRDRDKI